MGQIFFLSSLSPSDVSQISAMAFTEVREAYLGISFSQSVVTVPASCFKAGAIGRLNAPRIPTTTATAIDY